ncbi:MAG: hypothetical protein WBM09_08945 [Gallionella sp.]
MGTAKQNRKNGWALPTMSGETGHYQLQKKSCAQRTQNRFVFFPLCAAE